MFDDYIHGNADRVHFYCLITYTVMLTHSRLLLVEIMCVREREERDRERERERERERGEGGARRVSLC
jgi:hypothetical protein